MSSIIHEEDAESNSTVRKFPPANPAVVEEVPSLIASLNERLRAHGRGGECLSASAGEAAIVRVEKLLILLDAQRTTPLRTVEQGGVNTAESLAERSKQIRAKIASRFAERDDAPSFLRRLFSSANKAKSAALLAQHEAEMAIARVADQQARHASLVEQLASATKDLDDARSLRASLQQSLAELQAPQALALRWVRAAREYSEAEDQVRFVEWEAGKFTYALSIFPEAEKVLLRRVSEIEKQIKAVESEG